MSRRWLLLQALCRIAGQLCKAMIIELKMHRKNGFLLDDFSNKRIYTKPLTTEKSGFKNKKMALMECHHGGTPDRRTHFALKRKMIPNCLARKKKNCVFLLRSLRCSGEPTVQIRRKHDENK